MEAVVTIGLDIAKSVFQVHGVDAVGAIIVRRRLTRGKVLSFFETSSLPSRPGGLRHGALLGPRAQLAWPRCAADAAELCEALREASEERCG